MKRTGFKRRTEPATGKPLKRSKLRSKPLKPRKTINGTSKKKTTAKRKIKTPLQKAKEDLWEECKRITRARHGYTCYTCGKFSEAPHTGHFIPSSICSVEMRYSLDNLRPQCYRCNINLSGNWVAYEENLLRDKIDTVALKQKNRDTQNKQYDILWYQSKLEEYKKL